MSGGGIGSGIMHDRYIKRTKTRILVSVNNFCRPFQGKKGNDMQCKWRRFYENL